MNIRKGKMKTCQAMVFEGPYLIIMGHEIFGTIAGR
jgi:hypothetical protein